MHEVLHTLVRVDEVQGDRQADLWGVLELDAHPVVDLVDERLEEVHVFLELGGEPAELLCAPEYQLLGLVQG